MSDTTPINPSLPYWTPARIRGMSDGALVSASFTTGANAYEERTMFSGHARLWGDIDAAVRSEIAERKNR